MRNGQIIPVREEIAKKFGSGVPLEKEKMYANRKRKLEYRTDQDGSLIPLTETQTRLDKNELTPAERDKVCNLKIITENGKFTILLNMLSDCKISDIYNIMQEFSESPNFDIISNQSKQPIKREAKETLFELEMFPNARLNLKEIR